MPAHCHFINHCWFSQTIGRLEESFILIKMLINICAKCQIISIQYFNEKYFILKIVKKTIVNLFTICLFVLVFFRYSLLTPYRKTQQGNYVIQYSLLLYRLFCSTFLENNYQESYCVIFKNLYIVVDRLNKKNQKCSLSISNYFDFKKKLSCH